MPSFDPQSSILNSEEGVRQLRIYLQEEERQYHISNRRPNTPPSLQIEQTCIWLSSENDSTIQISNLLDIIQSEDSFCFLDSDLNVADGADITGITASDTLAEIKYNYSAPPFEPSPSWHTGSNCDYRSSPGTPESNSDLNNNNNNYSPSENPYTPSSISDLNSNNNYCPSPHTPASNADLNSNTNYFPRENPYTPSISDLNTNNNYFPSENPHTPASNVSLYSNDNYSPRENAYTPSSISELNSNNNDSPSEKPLSTLHLEGTLKTDFPLLENSFSSNLNNSQRFNNLTNEKDINTTITATNKNSVNVLSDKKIKHWPYLRTTLNSSPSSLKKKETALETQQIGENRYIINLRPIDKTSKKRKTSYNLNKDIECRYCSRLYSSPSSLRNHVRMKHRDEL
eukprot:Awhi_evm1s5403